MHANVHNVHDPEARVDLPRASEDEYGRRLLSNRIPALGEPSATPVVYSVDYRGPQVHLGHNRCPRLAESNGWGLGAFTRQSRRSGKAARVLGRTNHTGICVIASWAHCTAVKRSRPGASQKKMLPRRGEAFTALIKRRREARRGTFGGRRKEEQPPAWTLAKSRALFVLPPH